MLELKNIENIHIDEVRNISYDIAIFASGYESRASFLAKTLNIAQYRKKIVLGFAEHVQNDVRKANDEYYSKNAVTPIVLSSQDEMEIYNSLVSLFKELENVEILNILIDYTSMSRLWYSGILNFLRLQAKERINVYLNYSLGQYEKGYLDHSYTSINSLPAHEGSLSSNNKTLLVLAIGFSPYLVKSVIEEIEPNQIIGILPIPNIIPSYESISEEIKEDILTKDIDDWINCPINNLEYIFRTYAELASNNINQRDLIFLSLGPKIFTLASILVSQRFDQLTCLYLKSSKRDVCDIRATGDFICNKVIYA